MRLPGTLRPSTRSDQTPLQTPRGFFTSIVYVTPRNLRRTVKPFHFLGTHGSILRPSKSGRTPRMYWLRDHEATRRRCR